MRVQGLVSGGRGMGCIHIFVRAWGSGMLGCGAGRGGPAVPEEGRRTGPKRTQDFGNVKSMIMKPLYASEFVWECEASESPDMNEGGKTEAAMARRKRSEKIWERLNISRLGRGKG